MLRSCIDLAVDAVRSGGIPFAGLVAVNGEIVGRGVNRVRVDRDPTAHAEVVAIRDACSRLGPFALAGATLVASAEPCGLCLVAAVVSGIRRVVYAVSADEAAHFGFDYRSASRILGPSETWPFSFEQLSVDDAARPFRLWSDLRDEPALPG